jgi:hypothetical protein
MADNEVIIEVQARLDKAESAIKKFEGTAKDSGEKAGSALGEGMNKGAAIGFKALAVAAAAALAGIIVVFKKGIDAAIEQENAINDLNAALARTGQFSQAASLDFDRYADSLEKASIFTGDQILSNAALIQSLGKLSTDGLKQATQASVDLASALGVDLRTASQLVGKAAAGEVGSFSRYGLVIQQGATNAETFANALRQINDQFGGAGAAKLNTFSGATTQLNNSFGKLLQEFGNIIIKSPELAAAIKFITGFIQRATEVVKEFASNNVLGGILKNLVEFAQGVNKWVVMPLEVVFNAVGTIIRVMETGIRTSFLLIVKAAEGWLQIIGLFTDRFKDWERTVTQIADSAFNGVVESGERAFESAKGIFTTSGSDAAAGFLDGLAEAIEKAPPLAQELENDIPPVIEKIKLNMLSLGSAIANGFKATEVTVESLANTIKSQLGGGISNAFAALGGALAKGENGFSAFAKSALGVIGDIAIQMGTVLIAAGLGWSVIPGFQASAAAVPQGIALAIIGGALKAMAGGGGESGATAGGSTASAPMGTSTANLQETEQQDPGTSVTVNVQGNILDRRETGLEIANIINESFATGGIVLARGAVV